jgi:hypothetical protein
VCDFTGEKRAQIYSFGGKPALSFAVGPSRAALEAFDAAARAYVKEQGWLHFDEVLAAGPAFFDTGRVFSIRRSANAEVETGWKLAPNWRVNWQMNTFRRNHGEPWWRVALEKDSTMMRWTFVHELLELNPDVLSNEELIKFSALVAPLATDVPNDEFLQRYSAKAWSLTKPSDALLAGYRI